MLKFIDAGSWDRLESQGIGTIVPVRSRGGLSMSDRHDFFRKTAASEKFLHEFDTIKLADGDIPVHVNAIGALEYYGPNRKGDAFSGQMCRDWHHTFVTEGRNYIHHRNRDPDYRFGKIASSCYNDTMHRIELLIVTNGSEASARRNGGHVLPDEFLTQLEKNAEVPVSMGCTIKHDVCRICGNEARTRAEYCDETNCRDPKTGEYFPGCRTGLMKIASDGRQQYVDNIEPHFFDLSFVGVPADRTGYGFRADYLPHTLSKSASWESEDAVALSFGLTSSAPISATGRTEMNAMLSKLAAFEDECRRSRPEALMAYGLLATPQDPLIGLKLAGMIPGTRLSGVRWLAEQGVLLSPDNFAEAFTWNKTAEFLSGPLFTSACRRYTDDRDDAPARLLASLDAASDMKLAAMRLPVDWVRSNRLSLPKLAQAVSRGTLLAATLKTAHSDSSSNDAFADSYALLLAASLCRFPQPMRDEGIKTAVWYGLGTPSF